MNVNRRLLLDHRKQLWLSKLLQSRERKDSHCFKFIQNKWDLCVSVQNLT